MLKVNTMYRCWTVENLEFIIEIPTNHQLVLLIHQLMVLNLVMNNVNYWYCMCPRFTSSSDRKHPWVHFFIMG